MGSKFISNQDGRTIFQRFREILKHSKKFDMLVGYFRKSGYNSLADDLKSLEKIRILVGLNVDSKTFKAYLKSQEGTQQVLDFSQGAEITKKSILGGIEEDLESYQSSAGIKTEQDIEQGLRTFIELLQTDCSDPEGDKKKGGNGKKLEIKGYPDQLHAKVYIFYYTGDELGRVVTGSSNFSEAGLRDQLEFNVELRDDDDFKYIQPEFEKLWKRAVPLSSDFVQTINTRTWMNDKITPYELYFKFLYEYFKDELDYDKDFEIYLPEGYVDLEYQKQAVLAAKTILESYSGVFIADVVGLGKTTVSALLAQQLDGRILVICPPILMPTWHNTFLEFGIRNYKIESSGKLDQIFEWPDLEEFKYVFIDEAHHFRTEDTLSYALLHDIVADKKVILVGATPQNNSIRDYLAQLMLFQSPTNSQIPGMPNFEKFINEKLKKIEDMRKEFQKKAKILLEKNKMDEFKELKANFLVAYTTEMGSATEDVRNKILKYVMIRRTRKDIETYYSQDLTKKGINFPEVQDPLVLEYVYEGNLEDLFQETITAIKNLTYARYTPLLYLNSAISVLQQQSQRNLGGFMKSVLLKRLESSFFAFKKTLERFIKSYEDFIKMFKEGESIYIGTVPNLAELIENDDQEQIQELVEQEKLTKYSKGDFSTDLLLQLEHDLEILKQLNVPWQDIDVSKDPKLQRFLLELTSGALSHIEKIIVFTEAKETGEYLYEQLNPEHPGEVIFSHSQGGQYDSNYLNKNTAREMIRQNFDPKVKVADQSNKIRYLIATDSLSEGIDLHRSNTVLNYDLPWNPTIVLQRVGRVNRIGSQYEKIYIYNFFPAALADPHLGLEDRVKTKLQSFHMALGEDSKYLSIDEQVGSHHLFDENAYSKLTAKSTYLPEEEQHTELEYLMNLREVRDTDNVFLNHIKSLPKKARSTQAKDKENLPLELESKNKLLVTFFRQGKMKKFFVTTGGLSSEVNFLTAAAILKCDKLTEKGEIPTDYYQLLDENWKAFSRETNTPASNVMGSTSNRQVVINILKLLKKVKFDGFLEENNQYLIALIDCINRNLIPAYNIQNLRRSLESNTDAQTRFEIAREFYPASRLQKLLSKKAAIHSSAVEIVLSEYVTPTKKQGDSL